jgi:LAS superfamily LD-carboxypeptidase LdcB
VKNQIIASVAGLVLVAFIGYGIYSYNLLQKEKISILTELEKEQERNHELLEITRGQEATINSFQDQIRNISTTVGTLEKLSQTDKELLKKYSKVYFLSENYRPAQLTGINLKYLYNKEGDAFFHTQALPFLERLLESARASGVELLVASAFRSFETQASLKSEYKIVYGVGTANQFSADQGYSEHQLGTSVDFTTPEVGGLFTQFRTDPAYQWLLDNAYKYGFVLSYPEKNTYYKFEPWHWRFVGVLLADFLHKEKKYFYDLDQRQIDAYLIKLFD